MTGDQVVALVVGTAILVGCLTGFFAWQFGYAEGERDLQATRASLQSTQAQLDECTALASVFVFDDHHSLVDSAVRVPLVEAVLLVLDQEPGALVFLRYEDHGKQHSIYLRVEQ